MFLFLVNSSLNHDEQNTKVMSQFTSVHPLLVNQQPWVACHQFLERCKKLIILSELGNPFYFTSRRLTCNISLQWEHIILINKWQKQRNSLLWQSCLDISSNSPNWFTRKYEEANKENYSVIRYWNLTQRIAIG